MSKTLPNQVFVLDADKKPLTPCLPVIARKLLNAGKAKVFKPYPFTIILKKSVNDIPEPIEIRIDPGSKTTGIALVQGPQVIWGAQVTHRGQAIKSRLETRRAIRRSRRNRKTRYRKARFLNRTCPKGWLPPSLQHRVLTTMTWVSRLRKLAPIQSIALEFDIRVNDSVISVSRNQLKPVHRNDGYNYSFVGDCREMSEKKVRATRCNSEKKHY